MRLPPEKITVGERIRQNADAGIRELSKSIESLGQLQPILVDDKRNLIAGARRLRACELLGIDVWAETATDLDDAMRRLQAERDENTCRRDLSPTEMTRLGKRLESLEKPKAEERQQATRAKPGEAADKRPSNLDARDNGRTDAKVAAALGVSKDTYRKAKAVVEAAEEPDAPAEVVEAAAEMDRTGKVDPAYRKVVKKKPKQRGPFWSIGKDIAAIKKLVDKLKHRWNADDKEAVSAFLSTLAGEL